MSEPFEGPLPADAGDRELARSLRMMATVVIAALCVAALYVARSVFVPIAIATLLSFVLTPPVRLLKRIGFNHAVAVVVIVLAALCVTVAVSATLTRQASELAAALPSYQSTIKAKAASLRELVAANPMMEKSAGFFKEIGDFGRKLGSGAPASPAAQADNEPKPVPVEVREAAPSPFSFVQTIVGSALSPLETVAIVVIFVIFILLQREDLRNRFISLAGSRDLQRATVAMNDAAGRLSRYFLAQTLLNATFGAAVALGLYAIGVPGPVLFGIIGFLMRFVPYVGALATAALPIALAAAVDPGWTMALEALAFFIVLEIVVGQFIEPLLYGRNTGLSPLAVIVAATFWTWLWGPVGLVLATPLTVCVVVLGRHVEQLSFLDVLLGDAPALTPVEHFYQRLLVGDASEITEQAEEFLKTGELVAYYDSIALEGLLMAEADLRRGLLHAGHQRRVKQTIDEVIEDLSEHVDAPTDAEDAIAIDPGGSTGAGESPAPPARKPVICIAGRHVLDEAAAGLLAQALEKRGLAAKVEPADLLRVGGILHLPGVGRQMICLSYLGSQASLAQVRYAVRRLRRRLPEAWVLVGFWKSGAAEADELSAQTRADGWAASLADAVTRLAAETDAQGPCAPTPTGTDPRAAGGSGEGRQNAA